MTKDDITEFINYIDDPEGSADPQISIFEIISKSKQLKLGITVFQTVIQSFREAVKEGVDKSQLNKDQIRVAELLFEMFISSKAA